MGGRERETEIEASGGWESEAARERGRGGESKGVEVCIWVMALECSGDVREERELFVWVFVDVCMCGVFGVCWR